MGGKRQRKQPGGTEVSPQSGMTVDVVAEDERFVLQFELLRHDSRMHVAAKQKVRTLPQKINAIPASKSAVIDP